MPDARTAVEHVVSTTEQHDKKDRSTSPSNRTAFDELYVAEFELQVRRAALLLGSDHTAEDVVHDAFVEVFRRWDQIEDAGGYLNRCVVHGCHDHYRAARRTSQLLSRLRRPDESVEIADVLWDVVGTLPFKQRAVVVLRYYAGLNEPEIAALLDCPQGSVGPWLNRALRRMKGALR